MVWSIHDNWPNTSIEVPNCYTYCLASVTKWALACYSVNWAWLSQTTHKQLSPLLIYTIESIQTGLTLKSHVCSARKGCRYETATLVRFHSRARHCEWLQVPNWIKTTAELSTLNYPWTVTRCRPYDCMVGWRQRTIWLANLAGTHADTSYVHGLYAHSLKRIGIQNCTHNTVLCATPSASVEN